MLSRTARTRTLIASAGAVVLAATTLAAMPPAIAEGHNVVASGLDNPRLLSFTGDTLYVAEAGTGGNGPCIGSPENPDEEVCFGMSGAITRVRGGQQTRVLSGLPSLAGAGGGGASGPADVVVTGKQKYAITMGLGNDPALRSELGPAGKYFGTLISGAFPNAGPRIVADIGAFETATDPDGQGPDTNPTGLLQTGGGHVLTDSGGNSLLRVQGGHVSTIATFDSPGLGDVPFPPFQIPVQAVPTAVVVGPDGAYYVSELTGFPFVPGYSRIHRVVPGQAPTVYATGLTTVTDLAWDGNDLYAVQIGLFQGGPGSLVRVNTQGEHAVVADHMFAPYGVAVHDGSAYVTTCSVCPGDGQVIEVPLP